MPVKLPTGEHRDAHANQPSGSPSKAARGQITQLLLDWRSGDERARNELFESLHRELRRLAAIQLRGERSVTLQPTALVSEAYLRLVDAQKVDWQDRAHFLSMAVKVMRRVLVDRSRKLRTEKRGEGLVRVTYAPTLIGSTGHASNLDIERVDNALEALSKIHQRQAQIVELRFFGGLEVAEVAEVLSVSTATVTRDFAAARVWLFRELDRTGSARTGSE